MAVKTLKCEVFPVLKVRVQKAFPLMKRDGGGGGIARPLPQTSNCDVPWMRAHVLIEDLLSKNICRVCSS